MTEQEMLEAYKDSLYDINKCKNKGEPCSYGICSECNTSNNYRDFMSLTQTEPKEENDNG